ncbi:glucose-6-phosphate isomerase family protein [Promineifilum sp.]|uniref:glucose-6-phosphate isomerase family protein n=1 Tax=Promineifilum sp. TaxID=2664178 RepID=UPI0035B06522
MMSDLPFTFELDAPGFRPSHYDNHIRRTLSAMRGQYLDQAAYEALLAEGDAPLYEVYELNRPHVAGELLHGISIVHPGKVGEEYYMTKGHFHTVLETAEIYYCLHGQGAMVMETPEGEWAVETLVPGRVLYVPPRWAHRSVNTGDEDLITFFAYPGHAGHDYGTIEQQGFRKLLVERAGSPAIIDNPRWAR